MTLDPEITVDLKAALAAIEGDTSAVWKLTAADNLEAIARRVREELAGLLKEAAPTPEKRPTRPLDGQSRLKD